MQLFASASMEHSGAGIWEPRIHSKCEPLPRALKQFKFAGDLFSSDSLEGVSIMEFECTSSGSSCVASMLTQLKTLCHFTKLAEGKGVSAYIAPYQLV